MRNVDFYTIKELDYKTIEESLLNANISFEIQESIKKLIADHKALIEYRKKIIEKQKFQDGIFMDPAPNFPCSSSFLFKNKIFNIFFYNLITFVGCRINIIVLFYMPIIPCHLNSIS